MIYKVYMGYMELIISRVSYQAAPTPTIFPYDSTNEVSWVYKNQLYVRRNLKVPDFGFTNFSFKPTSNVSTVPKMEVRNTYTNCMHRACVRDVFIPKLAL